MFFRCLEKVFEEERNINKDGNSCYNKLVTVERDRGYFNTWGTPVGVSYWCTYWCAHILLYLDKFLKPCCSPYKVKTFPHSYALLRSLAFAKNFFYVKLTTFFKSENIKFDTKTTTNSESSS